MIRVLSQRACARASTARRCTLGAALLVVAAPSLAAALLVALAPSLAMAQSACPDGMAHVAIPGQTDFCIDRWEAHLVDHSPYEVPTTGVAATAPGVVPQAHISGQVAADACQNAGKRLCSNGEWLDACRGLQDRIYPYGDTYVEGACNDFRAEHPLVTLFGTTDPWIWSETNHPGINQQPDTVDLTGANAQCVTPTGIYDLHGNLNEWTNDPTGTFRGGYYVEAQINGTGCSYATTAHTTAHSDFSTGFRCCADPIGSAPTVPSLLGPASALLVALLGGSGVALWSLRRRSDAQPPA